MKNLGYQPFDSDRNFYQTHEIPSGVVAFHSGETSGDSKVVTCDYRNVMDGGKYRVADILLASPLFWRTLVAAQIRSYVGGVNLFHKKNIYFRADLLKDGPYCYIFPANEMFTENLQNLCSVLMSVPDSEVQDFIRGIPNLAYDDAAGKEKEKQRIVDWLDGVGLAWLPNQEEVFNNEKAWGAYIMF